MRSVVPTLTLIAFLCLAAYSQGYRIISLDHYDYLTQLTLLGGKLK